MNLSESLKIAVKCIKANWMRSLLTMLGIIIGISSVIMIIGAGTGARDYIVSLIEDMGSNAVMVTVDATQATDNDYITLEDVENIKNKVSGVDNCSPMLLGFGSSTIDKTATQATATLVGVNPDIQYAMNAPCDYGRFMTDDEYAAASPVAIIGVESAKVAFGYEDVVGEYITVSSSGATRKVKIIGVANIESMMGGASSGSTSQFAEMFQTGDQPTIMLFMPCTTLTQITGADAKLSMMYVMSEDGVDNESIGNATVNYLKAAHGNYSNNLYMAQDMATYSLRVGGIGVMNIMLVSVTERTREIGIRKSLGAKTKVIVTQFLTESIILCLIGGVIGVVVGVAGAYGACAIVKIEPNVTIGTILLALFFSSGVGLIFGVYPAKKAAKLSPIEALRRD